MRLFSAESIAKLERVPLGAALPFASTGPHKIQVLSIEDPKMVILEKYHPGRIALATPPSYARKQDPK